MVRFEVSSGLQFENKTIKNLKFIKHCKFKNKTTFNKYNIFSYMYVSMPIF